MASTPSNAPLPTTLSGVLPYSFSTIGVIGTVVVIVILVLVLLMICLACFAMCLRMSRPKPRPYIEPEYGDRKKTPSTLKLPRKTSGEKTINSNSSTLVSEREAVQSPMETHQPNYVPLEKSSNIADYQRLHQDGYSPYDYNQSGAQHTYNDYNHSYQLPSVMTNAKDASMGSKSKQHNGQPKYPHTNYQTYYDDEFSNARLSAITIPRHATVPSNNKPKFTRPIAQRKTDNEPSSSWPRAGITHQPRNLPLASSQRTVKSPGREESDFSENEQSLRRPTRAVKPRNQKEVDLKQASASAHRFVQPSTKDLPRGGKVNVQQRLGEKGGYVKSSSASRVERPTYQARSNNRRN